MTKAAHMKKLEKAYFSNIKVERSSAHISGVCICHSMVKSDGLIMDLPTIVIRVATASADHRTVLCEMCAPKVVIDVTAQLNAIRLGEENDEQSSDTGTG